MGWEDQGRQGHGWFGSGTTGAVAVAAPGRDEAAVAKQVPDRPAPPSGKRAAPEVPPLPAVNVEARKPGPPDVPAIVAALTTMATRLGPLAFAEAAAALLATLPEIRAMNSEIPWRYRVVPPPILHPEHGSGE